MAPRPAETPNTTPEATESEPIDFRAAAALSGDRHALEAIWAEHRRWVAAILLAHKPKWAEVDDLLQDVAAAFLKKGHEIREPGAIRGWLRSVAVNAAHAAARFGKARPFHAGAPRSGGVEASDLPGARVLHTPGRDASHDERISDLAEGRRLLALAAQLADGYREPLLLKCVQGLSYREIGRILDLPETTIETRIARARRQLRELAFSSESKREGPGNE